MVGKVMKCLWVAAGLLILFAGVAAASADSDEVTVSQAIALALDQHTDIRQAELGLQLAELELDAAWTRATIPSINLSIKPPSLSLAGFSSDVTGDFTIGLSPPWGTSSKVSASLDVTWDSETSGWEILNWGIVYMQTLDFSSPDAASQELETKQQAVEDARTALRKAKNAVILDTGKTYANLLAACVRLEQAEKDFGQAEAELVQMEELFEAGLKGQTVLQEARLDVLDAQIELDEQQLGFATDKEAFAREVLGLISDGSFELVPFQLLLEELRQATVDLLDQEELVTTAVRAATEVEKAQRSVTDAQEDLDATRRSALPDLSFEVGVDEKGWRLGWNLSFDLLAPDRQLKIEMANARLMLAEEKLAATREQVQDRLLNQQAALRKALNKVDRLPLEQKKWALKETVMQAKVEAGAISEDDWEAFLDDKDAFELTTDEREASLLLIYLEYRDSLGMELNWEEWL